MPWVWEAVNEVVATGYNPYATKELSNRFDGRAVGDCARGDAAGEERPDGQASDVLAARDVECDLLPGQERLHVASTAA